MDTSADTKRTKKIEQKSFYMYRTLFICGLSRPGGVVHPTHNRVKTKPYPKPHFYGTHELTTQKIPRKD